MQLLFSFDRAQELKTTLMQTLASQLSSILILVSKQHGKTYLDQVKNAALCPRFSICPSLITLLTDSDAALARDKELSPGK